MATSAEIMEILINDIPEEGLEIAATESDAWLGCILREVYGGAFEGSDHAELGVSIHRIDGNINIDGSLDFTCHPDCDRCLAHYQQSYSLHLHEVLAPLADIEDRDVHRRDQGVEVVKEDLEFDFYEGDRFDLAKVVREQTFLARPMKCLCVEDCKGLCPRCGKNLNEGPCGCVDEHNDARWAVLRGVKVSPSSKLKGQRSKGRRK